MFLCVFHFRQSSRSQTCKVRIDPIQFHRVPISNVQGSDQTDPISSSPDLRRSRFVSTQSDFIESRSLTCKVRIDPIRFHRVPISNVQGPDRPDPISSSPDLKRARYRDPISSSARTRPMSEEDSNSKDLQFPISDFRFSIFDKQTFDNSSSLKKRLCVGRK
jgi:hypothetical protein